MKYFPKHLVDIGKSVIFVMQTKPIEQEFMCSIFHKKHWVVIDKFIKEGEYTIKYVVVYQCKETGKIKVSTKRL